MNNSILTQSFIGHVPPRELIELQLKACPTVSGFAVRDADGLSFDHYGLPTSVEHVMKLLEATKDMDLFLFLAHWPKRSDGTILGQEGKDIQPFVLSAGDSNELLYFAEGDFSKFQNFESGRTDEGNLASELIDPMLYDYFEMVQGDPAKFAEKLSSKAFKTMCEAAFGARGCFAFLPKVGEPVLFGENSMGGTFEWGNTTQLCGFGTPKKADSPITAAVSSAVSSAKNKFSNFLGGAPKATADGKPLPDGVHEVPKAPLPAQPHPDGQPPAIPDQQPVIPVPAKTDTAVKDDNRSAVKPPAKLESSARNAWLRLFYGPSGELPRDHKNKNIAVLVPPAILPFAQKPVETKSQVEAMVKEVTALWKGGTPASSSAPLPDTTPKADEKRPTSDFIAGMSDKEMAVTTSIMAGWAARDQSKRPSPLDIQKGEATWPLFSEKHGISLTDVMFWPVADLMELTGGNKAAVMLIIELRREFGKHLDITALINTATPKAKEVSASQTLTPKEVGAQQSVTAPSAKGNFLGLKSRTG